MKVTQKIMIACLLTSEGADESTTKELIKVLEEGIDLQEKDSIELFNQLMLRITTAPPTGAAGDVIRLMIAKDRLDENNEKFGIALSGLEKVMKILDSKPTNDFAAKILMRRVLDTIDTAKAELV